MSDEAEVAATPSSPLEVLVRDVIGPLVRADGGQVAWIGVDNGVARVQLRGACAGCPGQSYTASSVILPLLQTVDATITNVRVELGL